MALNTRSNKAMLCNGIGESEGYDSGYFERIAVGLAQAQPWDTVERNVCRTRHRHRKNYFMSEIGGSQRTAASIDEFSDRAAELAGRMIEHDIIVWNTRLREDQEEPTDPSNGSGREFGEVYRPSPAILSDSYPSTVLN